MYMMCYCRKLTLSPEGPGGPFDPEEPFAPALPAGPWSPSSPGGPYEMPFSRHSLKCVTNDLLLTHLTQVDLAAHSFLDFQWHLLVQIGHFLHQYPAESVCIYSSMGCTSSLQAQDENYSSLNGKLIHSALVY